MMLSFTVIMPPVVLTLIPPSVVSPWFALVRVIVLCVCSLLILRVQLVFPFCA